MRQQLKQQLKDMIATLGRAEGILDSRSKKKDEDAVNQLLEDMQNSAMAIGTTIEEEEGLETETVEHLEEYCELLWQYMTAGELKDRFQVGRLLAGKRGEIVSSLEDEFEGRLEVVFLICRADRWSRMERIWSVARENPSYDCRVLVSSCSECQEEGKAGMFHDELGMFPASIGAMDYEFYDMATCKPDLVFLDGPYAEDGGPGPEYDFAKVRESAEAVIYMPYYEEEGQVVRADCMLPQVLKSDMVIVQSENIRDAYRAILCKEKDGKEIIKKIGVMETVNMDRILQNGVKNR